MSLPHQITHVPLGLEVLSTFCPSSAFLDLSAMFILPPLPLLERFSRHSRCINKSAVLSRPGLYNVPAHQPRNLTHPLLCSFSS